MTIDTAHIVFDFGGVLMQHDRAGCLHVLRQFLSDEDIRDVLGFGNDKTDTLRARFERGAIDTRCFLDHVLALCKTGTTEQQVVDAWNTMHAGIPDEAWETIRALRAQGYRTCLMSNTDEIHWQHTLSLYRQQVESLFDDVFLSFELGLTKPAEAFFRHVADALHDDRTLFVDDMETNRLAAQQYVGWKTCASMEELKVTMTYKHIYLAGGCFWGTEHFFKQIAGVVKTEVGFANGQTDNPTYEQVYTDTTGYAETVHVVYDPDKVSPEFLLRMFFVAIDPTSLNKQGHDEGTRYRTGIYYTDAADLPAIEKVYAEEQNKYAQPLVVEKLPLRNFYPADEYHQDYLDKHPDGYCHLPKALFEFARKNNKPQ